MLEGILAMKWTFEYYLFVFKVKIDISGRASKRIGIRVVPKPRFT